MSFPLIRVGLLFWLMLRLAHLVGRLWNRFRETTAVPGPSPYRYRIFRHKGRATSVCIGVDVPDQLRFSIRRERAFDRFAQRIGLARELQAGDPAFDAALYILSDDPQVQELCRRDAGVRRALLELLQSGDCDAVHCDAGSIWVPLKPAAAGADRRLEDAAIAAALAPTVVPRLTVIRDAIAQRPLPFWSDAEDPTLRHQSMLLWATAILGGLGLLAWLFEGDGAVPRLLHTDRVDLVATFTALSSAIALLVGAAALLRHTSRMHIVVLEILLTALPGAWMASHALLAQYDMRADSLRGQRVRAVIDDRRETHGSRIRSYYLEFGQVPSGLEDTRMRVPRAVYESAVIGQCAHLTIRPGALGDAWLSSIDFGAC